MAWRFHCWFQNFRLPFAAELNRYTYQELCCPIVPTVAILKLTSCLLSEAKISCSFPFSQCPSQLQENDLILLSESYKTRTAGEKAIRYRMTFHCCARSGSEVPAKRYIIHGWNFTRLRSPFDISDFKESSKVYRRAPYIVYLAPEDVSSLLTSGLLN